MWLFSACELYCGCDEAHAFCHPGGSALLAIGYWTPDVGLASRWKMQSSSFCTSERACHLLSETRSNGRPGHVVINVHYKKGMPFVHSLSCARCGCGVCHSLSWQSFSFCSKLFIFVKRKASVQRSFFAE